MTTVSKQTELAVRLPIGATELARFMAVTSSRGVEMLARCSYQDRHFTVVLLVPTDPARTIQVLSEAGFPFKINTIVLVNAAYEPGLAMDIRCRLAAAHLGVLYSYASREDGQTILAFKTSDDDQAVQLLNRPRPAQSRPVAVATLDHSAAIA